jgi:APA family basic amino acid/polyamine antiporter
MSEAAHDGEAAPAKAGDGNPPLISTGTATLLAIAHMVGIGVFTSLGFQIREIPSPFALLMLWVVGGVVALAGALSYAELGAALPRSGGEYNFLSRIYHPALGFLAGWISLTAGFSAPAALYAMAFGTYAVGSIAPGMQPLALALAATALITLVHMSGVRFGIAFQNLSTWLKIALALVLIVAGFVSGGNSEPISFAPSWNDLTLMTSSSFGISLVFVMFSYSGWNAATYIAGDIRDTGKSLPRSLMLATLVVLVLYTGLNAAFLYSTPMSAMSGQLEVAAIVGKTIFGEAGGRIVGALMCFSLISSVSVMMWVGPRVAAVVGEDVVWLRFLSQRNQRGVPRAALLTQAAIVVGFLATGSFETVLDYIQFSLTLTSFLAVLGVIVLRVTRPELPRPYKMTGYPLVPLVFLVVTAIMLVHLVIERPFQSFAGFALAAIGLVIYFRSPHGSGAVQQASID